MKPAELKRLYRIVKVQLEYGLDELLPDHHLHPSAATGA